MNAMLACRLREAIAMRSGDRLSKLMRRRIGPAEIEAFGENHKPTSLLGAAHDCFDRAIEIVLRAAAVYKYLRHGDSI